MPPAKKAAVAAVVPMPNTSAALKVGDFVNVVTDRSVRRSLEVLAFEHGCLVVRADLNREPFSEIVLIPWTAIESVGVVGAR